MRILIDTHVLIWHLEDDSRLSKSRSDLVDDPANSILISIASLWEISIKLSRGKLKLSKSIDDIVNAIEHSTNSFLHIEPEHVTEVAKLPFHHSDPFDRLIISQALVEKMPIMTVGGHFSDYGVELL